MSHSLPRQAPQLPHKSRALRMQTGESDHKRLVSPCFKAVIGGCIEMALAASGLTKKEASHGMGYGENQAPLSNWIVGKETPQLAKLWMLGDEFRAQFVIALSRACGTGVEVKTVVEVRRRA